MENDEDDDNLYIELHIIEHIEKHENEVIDIVDEIDEIEVWIHQQILLQVVAHHHYDNDEIDEIDIIDETEVIDDIHIYSINGIEK